MNKPQCPNERSSEEKLRLVRAAEGLGEAALGAFLRHEGLHEAHLKQWRSAALGGVSCEDVRAKPESKRMRELERGLKRKDKALAETAVLLVLKKKYRRSGARTRWTKQPCGAADAAGVGGRNGGGGRRQQQACALLGVSKRTVERSEEAGESSGSACVSQRAGSSGPQQCMELGYHVSVLSSKGLILLSIFDNGCKQP